ncbi:hypothetical protein M7I_5797 [Glarea lozoyensis 74030]|uniref:Uncharacterized protein n=1 Tax=Glarea lozoyensis (strain ATCC 74030 / MF5533) TaxID=1104152 RepID=H0ESV0_GLAL7|nr:hypothetical protein M7I_5797 [Glarea lozoyensis 74030]
MTHETADCDPEHQTHGPPQNKCAGYDCLFGLFRDSEDGDESCWIHEPLANV